jgi:hypothetical protein
MYYNNARIVGINQIIDKILDIKDWVPMKKMLTRIEAQIIE